MSPTPTLRSPLRSPRQGRPGARPPQAEEDKQVTDAAAVVIEIGRAAVDGRPGGHDLEDLTADLVAEVDLSVSVDAERRRLL